MIFSLKHIYLLILERHKHIMSILIMFFVIIFSSYAGSVVYVPEYPDDYRSVEEIKKTAEMYYKKTEEKGLDVRYISDIEELSSEDTVLYVIAHGNSRGILYKNSEKNSWQVLTWYHLLLAIKEAKIRTLVVDTCYSGSIYTWAELVQFNVGIRIYATCDAGSLTGAPIGEASYFSIQWRYDKAFNPEYKYYSAKPALKAKTDSCNDFS